MFGQASWFQRRKYGGWGITPKTKQGWLYVGGMIAFLILLQNFPLVSPAVQNYLFYAGLAILLLDVLHIMATLKKDEFETKVEALAERNGAWAMITAIIIGIFFQVAQSVSNNLQAVDPFLLMALFAGTIVKSLSNWWFERKGINQ